MKNKSKGIEKAENKNRYWNKSGNSPTPTRSFMCSWRAYRRRWCRVPSMRSSSDGQKRRRTVWSERRNGYKYNGIFSSDRFSFLFLPFNWPMNGTLDLIFHDDISTPRLFFCPSVRRQCLVRNGSVDCHTVSRLRHLTRSSASSLRPIQESGRFRHRNKPYCARVWPVVD